MSSDDVVPALKLPCCGPWIRRVRGVVVIVPTQTVAREGAPERVSVNSAPKIPQALQHSNFCSDYRLGRRSERVSVNSAPENPRALQLQVQTPTGME